MYPFQPFSVTLLLALVFTPEALNCQFRGGDREEEEEKEEGGIVPTIIHPPYFAPNFPPPNIFEPWFPWP